MLNIDPRAAFLVEHSPYVQAGHGTFLCADGAVVEGDRAFEPPVDPAELAAAQLAYTRELLKQEEKAFYDQRTYLIDRATAAVRFPNLPGIAQEQVDELRAGRQRILALRARVRELEPIASKVQRNQMAVERQGELERYSQEQASLRGAVAQLTPEG